MMRLFYAVRLPQELREDLGGAADAAAKAVRGAGGRVKPVETANMHVTLRFLGEVSGQISRNLIGEPFGNAVSGALSEWGERSRELRLKGVGGFPNLRSPKVLWAGIEGATGLLSLLHKSLDDMALAQGLEPERGRYSPHITLCRLPEGLPGDGKCLSGWIGGHEAREFGSMEDWEVCLYKSDLSKEGPTYTPLDARGLR